MGVVSGEGVLVKKNKLAESGIIDHSARVSHGLKLNIKHEKDWGFFSISVSTICVNMSAMWSRERWISDKEFRQCLELHHTPVERCWGSSFFHSVASPGSQRYESPPSPILHTQTLFVPATYHGCFWPLRAQPLIISSAYCWSANRQEWHIYLVLQGSTQNVPRCLASRT